MGMGVRGLSMYATTHTGGRPQIFTILKKNHTSTMTQQTTITLITLLVIAIIGITTGYSTPNSSSSSSQTKSRIISRQSFLTSIATTSCITFLGTQPAFAKEVDPAVKGTKNDPEFQACLSNCMYECTKPKGAEQKSRGECLPECKTKCAKTKEQAGGKIMDRM